MSGRILRLLVLAALVALGVWGWRLRHPSPEHIIRKELAELARTACVPADEANLRKLANAQKLASFFTSDAELTIDVPGRFSQTISGRAEVQEKALGARSMLGGLTVEFLDVNVTVAPDAESATARLTARANLPGDSVPQVEELKVGFKKVEGDWLIQRAENVKTLH
jgi:ketosteroid isomerase-like protein